MKSVTTGVTITEEIIPIGAKVPKSLSEMGEVKICAERLTQNEEESFSDTILEKWEFKISENKRIPVRAPYDKINPAFL